MGIKAEKILCMKISIITVCYNSAATLEDTIRSVIAQTYPNIEYIIIDGGSKDGTQAIVEKYREHIACFISEPDRGLYDAMNKGLQAATGDVIGILNSDDFFFDEQVVQAVADNMQGADAVFADIAFYQAPDFERVIRHYSSRPFADSGNWLRQLAIGNMPAHPSLYVRKAAYDKVGLYSLEYKIAADFDMVARLFTLPDFTARYLPQVVVKMRPGGLSTQGIKSKLHLLREDLAICRSLGIKSNYLKLLSKYPRKLLGFIIKG